MKLSDTISNTLRNGDVLSLFKRDRYLNILHCVDFLHESPTDDHFQSRYVLNLCDVIHKNNELVCLFPNHPKEKKRVLRVSSCWSLDSLNVTINERIKESLMETAEAGRTRFAVAFGSHVYCCSDVMSTVYIFWATHINKINSGNVANTQYREWPVIFNYDGQYKPKAIYILKNTINDTFYDLRVIPIVANNPILMFPKTPLLVCEARPPVAQRKHIDTITRNEAIVIATMPTKEVLTWLPHQKNPLGESSDGEQIMVVDNDNSDSGVSVSMESPRPHVQLQLAKVKHTTPPDPFAEDEYN